MMQTYRKAILITADEKLMNEVLNTRVTHLWQTKQTQSVRD